MDKRVKRVRGVGAAACAVTWCVVSAPGLDAGAQVRPTRPPVPRNAYFSDGEPVGLPVDTKLGNSRCSADDYTFFNVKDDGQSGGLPTLYRVAVSGEVKLIARKFPLEARHLRMLDFYAGERLVTLMEVGSGSDDDAAQRDVEYFVSTSDHDGDHPGLVKLDIRFTPMRIAQFPSGDFLVLGWDKFHTVSVLVQAHEDGDVRRFMDLNADQVPENKDGAKSPEGGQFVPFDKQILLTFPGTSKRVHVLSEGADERTLQPAVPPGYVFHDILNSSDRPFFLMRVQADETTVKPKEGEVEPVPKQRLFEIDTWRGGQINEYVFNKPEIRAVTCGAHGLLTAVYTQASVDGSVKDSAQGSGSNATADAPHDSPKPQVLVISTARR